MLKEFRPRGEGFRVLMPGVPKKKVLEVAGAPTRQYMLDRGTEAYLVSVAELPIPEGEDARATQQRLSGARDQMVKNLKGTLLDERAVKLGGRHPGRHVEVELPDGKNVLVGRFYIAGTSMYQVIAVGSRRFVRSPETTRYLGSFALTE